MDLKYKPIIDHLNSVTFKLNEMIQTDQGNPQ